MPDKEELEERIIEMLDAENDVRYNENERRYSDAKCS